MWDRTLEEEVASGRKPGCSRDWIQEHQWAYIRVGFDPFLVARRVDHLRVLKNESGQEDLHFNVQNRVGISGQIIPVGSCVLRHGQKEIEADGNN
jgi:hypothetical protein